MIIKISSSSGVKPIDISKKETVKSLKDLIEKEFEVLVERQKLFFSGKLLNNDVQLFKYNIKDGYVVQLMESQVVEEAANKENTTKADTTKEEVQISEYYKKNEIVEVRDLEDGSFYEAEIIDIFESSPDSKDQDKENKTENTETEKSPKLETNNKTDDRNVVYKISYEREGESIIRAVSLSDIRPKSIHLVDVTKLKIRQTIHLNYNLKRPNAWGKWFDFYVLEIDRIKGLHLIGKLVRGESFVENEIRIDCKARALTMFLIRSNILLEKRDVGFDIGYKPSFCKKCESDITKKCNDCGCKICGLRTDPENTVICDECDFGYHIYCLSPKLEKVPEDDWYCSECKNENDIVKEGDQVKTNKKYQADKSKSTRDWGRGMATAGRSTTNTIVPVTHFGAVPGVEVGTNWRFRVQVAEAGIHRPHVAGIAGRQDLGAFSIVLAGGYEDDKDDGDEVLYTGSGGRDLAGNKRVSSQSHDQELTRMNKALAKNCNVKINNIEGAESSNWKAGKPVRVVRSHKEKSKFAPEEGFRYDGLYKIVKYFPKTGKSGFKVWQFLLRRDDPTPAPWTKEGKKHIQDHGLDYVIYPENYQEIQAAKKRKLNNGSDEEDEVTTSKKPKPKALPFELPEDIKKLIAEDVLNDRNWTDVNSFLESGKSVYLNELSKTFTCICCQHLVHKPVTIKCTHTFCLHCIKKSRKTTDNKCPLCKENIVDKFQINEALSTILTTLYPGYNADRK